MFANSSSTLITIALISVSFVVVGTILLVFGLIYLIIAIKVYNQAYDQWHDAWWIYNTADLNDQPSSMHIIISTIITISGFVVLMFGLKPYFTKLSLNYHKETLDYAGKEMTDVGTKIVDIGAPVANKAIDKIVVPSAKKIKNVVKKQGHDFDGEMMHCKHCGKEIMTDSKYCKYCGEKQ